MKAAIYGAEKYLCLEALNAGLLVGGHKTIVKNHKFFADADVEMGVDACFVWGYRQGYGKAIADAYIGMGIPTYIAEQSIFRNSRPDLWQVSFGNINIFEPTDNHERLSELGIIIRPKKTLRGKSSFLLCGQMPNDAQHNLGLDALVEWYMGTIGRLRKSHPKAKIIWRPHPRMTEQEFNIFAEIADGVSDPRREDLDSALKGKRAVVLINSSLAVYSWENGVQVMSKPGTWLDPGNPGNAETLEERHDVGAITNLLAGAANIHFSEAELRSGKWLTRLQTN